MKAWIDRQPLDVLLGFILLLLALMFGVGVLDWWIAHQVNWWVYGLLSVAVLIFRVAIRMGREWSR